MPAVLAVSSPASSAECPTSPLHTGYDVTCKHALVVTVADIRYLANKMQRFVGGDARIRVWFDEEQWRSYSFDAFVEDALLEDSLDHGTRRMVTKVGVTTTSLDDNLDAVLVIEAGPVSTASIVIVGPEERASKLFRIMNNHLARMRPLYSAVSSEAFGLVGVFSALVATFAGLEGEWSAFFACLLLMLVANPVAWRNLFPRVTFRMCGGELRARSADAWRTVVVSSIGLTLLGSALYELIRG